MQTKGGQSLATTLGTAYAIAISIKKDYTYNVTVNAGKESNDPVSSPTLEIGAIISLPNPNTTNPTACGAVDQNKWTVLQTNRIGSSPINYQNFQNYSIVQNYKANGNYSYLTVLAYGGSLTEATNVLINSITITETVPTASFTLAPAIVSKSCGTALSQTFTVTNVNNTPGVTGYTWNLGTAANGWIYNGVAAPQTIVTTTNTITLTAAACVIGLQNVTATANTGSTGYSTNSSAVAFSYPFSINGASSICTTPAAYTVNNLSCNATVAWSVAPSGIVTLPNPSSGPQTTIAKIADGAVALSATINNACGKTITINRRVKTDAVIPSFAIRANIPCQPGSVIQAVTFTADPGSTNTIYHWRSVSNGVSTTIPGTGSSVWKKFSLGSYQVYAWGENACGDGDEAVINFNILSCPHIVQSAGTFTVSPNPTTDNITIAAAKPKDAVFSKTGKAMIYQLKVTDPLGNVRKEYKYSSGTSNTNISLKGLISGMYTIQAYDGTSWSSVQVIKQ